MGTKRLVVLINKWYTMGKGSQRFIIMLWSCVLCLLCRTQKMVDSLHCHHTYLHDDSVSEALLGPHFDWC